jgi:hypothetical protein
MYWRSARDMHQMELARARPWDRDHGANGPAGFSRCGQVAVICAELGDILERAPVGLDALLSPWPGSPEISRRYG